MSFDAGQFTSIITETEIGRVGDDLAVVYHPEGIFSNLTGGQNVMVNRSGFNTANVVLNHSNDVFFIPEPAGFGTLDFFNGNTLLYRADYSVLQPTSPNITNTVAEPLASTLSVYSNVTNQNQSEFVPDLQYQQTITTPIGSTLSNIFIGNIPGDTNLYPLDGSFIPLIEITSASENTIITMGMFQQSTVTWLSVGIGVRQINTNLNEFILMGDRMVNYGSDSDCFFNLHVKAASDTRVLLSMTTSRLFRDGYDRTPWRRRNIYWHLIYMGNIEFIFYMGNGYRV